LVVRLDVVLGLDFTVHASVYGKVPFLPQGLAVVVVVVVVVVVAVLHDLTPSQCILEDYSRCGR
jgi:hypothetical protein